MSASAFQVSSLRDLFSQNDAGAFAQLRNSRNSTSLPDVTKLKAQNAKFNGHIRLCYVTVITAYNAAQNQRMGLSARYYAGADYKSTGLQFYSSGAECTFCSESSLAGLEGLDTSVFTSSEFSTFTSNKMHGVERMQGNQCQNATHSNNPTRLRKCDWEV